MTHAKKPPEGTNVSRNIKEFLTERHYLSALSFLNEVMASEPFSGERSNAVKMSETPTRPTEAVRIRQRIQVLNVGFNIRIKLSLREEMQDFFCATIKFMN